MRARPLSLTVALALATSPVLADNARSRDGGSSSSSAGARHHSGGGSSSSGSGHSAGSSGGSSQPSGQRTEAQRRHPRAGTGTGWRRGGHGGYYGYPYYPYWGPSYWGYGYYPYYYGAYYGGGYPYYGGHYYGGYPVSSRVTGSVRLMVDPEKTRVYVDGYYAGVSDDFDGIFQRLHVSPGKHEIKLQLDGYQTQRFRVYVVPDETLKIHFDMVKGSGEGSEAVMGDREAAEAYTRDNWRDARDRYESNRRDSGSSARDGEYEDGDRSNRAATLADRGPALLRLRVEPDDASVYVDGTFQGTARQAQRLDLTPGRHRVEVVRPGYRTFERDVEIEADRPSDLDVTLER